MTKSGPFLLKDAASLARKGWGSAAKFPVVKPGFNTGYNGISRTSLQFVQLSCAVQRSRANPPRNEYLIAKVRGKLGTFFSNGY